MNKSALFKKLRLDPEKKILVINAPPAYGKILEELDFDTTFADQDKGTYDFVQVFATSQDELVELVSRAFGAGKYDCMFWACYPKGSGKIRSDIKRDTVWSAMSCTGIRPVTQVAIDETWSAMRGRPEEAIGKSEIVFARKLDDPSAPGTGGFIQGGQSPGFCPHSMPAARRSGNHYPFRSLYPG